MARNMRHTQEVGDHIQVFGLRDTPVIRERIGPPDYLIASLTCFNDALCHITHIDDRHNVLARTNNETFAGINQGDKTAKACVVTRAINPGRSHNDYRRATPLYKILNQLLSGYLGAAIGIILGAKWRILGHNTMQVMPVHRDRTCMHYSLDTCIHRRRDQIGYSPDIY